MSEATVISSSTGYLLEQAPEHPRANAHTGYVLQHVLVAERAIGRPLPAGAVVHHVDGDGSNNEPANLVVCQDRAYHALIHQRERALKACGDPDALPCAFCKVHDRAENMIPHGTLSRNRWTHRECRNRYNRAYHRRRNAARKESLR